MDGEDIQKLFAHAGRGAWSFDLVYGYRRKDDPTGSYFTDPLVPGQYTQDRNLHAQVQYQEGLGDALQVSGRVFMGRQDYTGGESYGLQPFKSTGSSRWYGTEWRLLSTAWTGNKLLLGLELQNNTRDDQAQLDITDPSNDIVIADSGHRAGVYAQDEWHVADSVTATLGLRLDRNSVTGTQSSPRGALIWQATGDTTLKALYGRAHRAPNAFERLFEDGGQSQVANLGLGGETIDTLEGVVDHRVARDFSIRGSLYQWTMRNIITLGIDPVSGLSQYQSGDNVKAHGVEISADKTWPGGGRLRASASYQHAKYDQGDRLPNSPEWLGKLNLSAPLPWKRLRLGYELQYDSRRLAIDGTRVDGYWLSNLQLTASSWIKGLDVSLGLYNLFDRHYAQPASDINWQKALEQDGRAIRAKIEYRF
jgi:outer membrane receptor protein involved in Fe transport